MVTRVLFTLWSGSFVIDMRICLAFLLQRMSLPTSHFEFLANTIRNVKLLIGSYSVHLQNIRSLYRHVECRGGSNNCFQVVGKTLTIDNLSPNILGMEYAIRGPLVIRAQEIEKELQSVCTSFIS